MQDAPFLGQQMPVNLLDDFDSALTSDGGSSPGQHDVLRDLCSNDSEDGLLLRFMFLTSDDTEQHILVKRPKLEEASRVVPKVAKPTPQEKKAAQRSGLVPIARVNQVFLHVTSTDQQFLASLSEDEKTLLTAEGVVLPVGRAITKAEERELKQLRRKIKNKLSAQDSRRRRKEHMSTLEVENQDLRSQVC